LKIDGEERIGIEKVEDGREWGLLFFFGSDIDNLFLVVNGVYVFER